ncbi:MAG: nucleotide exchange factor GrpE, partial [Clostridia bacterium]|nr:nucleotide exchange factor GrpE [Clostridia bacterium]
MAKEKKQNTAEKPENEEETKPQTQAEEAAEATAENPVEEPTEQPAEPEAEQPDETEALKKQLADLNDKLLRTAAEYDNFRRRSQKEKEAIYTDSKAEIIGRLLPVIDNFERASAAEADPENY